MKNNLEMKKQSGFTLIEIAIVMVIIGLLIGGVLKGQALIDNAKIKSVINDMNGVQAAWYGYYDRKHVYPSVESDYITVTANKFWQQTRAEGLTVGDPAAVGAGVAGINAMGGYIGVVNSAGATGISGPAVCTSVLSKYAQGIDAGLDDGLVTNGGVRGAGSLTTINEPLATVVPLTTAYATSGYVVLCKEL